MSEGCRSSTTSVGQALDSQKAALRSEVFGLNARCSSSSYDFSHLARTYLDMVITGEGPCARKVRPGSGQTPPSCRRPRAPRKARTLAETEPIMPFPNAIASHSLAKLASSKRFTPCSLYRAESSLLPSCGAGLECVIRTIEPKPRGTTQSQAACLQSQDKAAASDDLKTGTSKLAAGTLH